MVREKIRSKMKAIMISIKPEWVEKILKREKTIEIRKTMPKCELPCKVYIYCTKGRILWLHHKETIVLGDTKFTSYLLNGKVVAEFTLNIVECFTTDYRRDVEQTTRILEKACSNCVEAMEYEENRPCLYAWHIDNLKIYDKPKELSEFGIKRAFQSWGYVEEIK